MCCMFTTLVLFGPRLGILVWWLINPVRFDLAFGERWLLTLLAWLFIPLFSCFSRRCCRV